MFYDCVFSLNYDSLSKIQEYITDSIWHPFNSPDYLTIAKNEKSAESGIRIDELGHSTDNLWADYRVELNLGQKTDYAETITETNTVKKNDNL